MNMDAKIPSGKTSRIAIVLLMLLLFLAGCTSPLDSTGGASATSTPVASTGSTATTPSPLAQQLSSNSTAQPTSSSIGGATVTPTMDTGGTGNGTSTSTSSTDSAFALANGFQQAIENVADRVRPAVVTVVNKLTGPQGNFAGEALGTGMIVDQQGHIFTNNHVIAGSSQGGLSVIFSDGAKAPATLVGADEVSDIAVLQVNHPVTATVTLGDYSQVKVGQVAIAIGSALGTFEDTVTMGVVSGLNRQLPGAVGSDIEPMIQTDAAINHGNSGGPLLDLNGNVIGMNTAAIMSTGASSGSGQLAQGLGFAIPVNTIKKVTTQILKTGNVPRPYLGVATRPVSPQLSSYYGLVGPDGNLLTSGELVVQVDPGSAADTGGLQPGDVITAVDGTQVDTTNPLANLLLNHNPGDKVNLTVVRNGNQQTIQVTLGTRPATPTVPTPTGNGNGNGNGPLPGNGTPTIP